MALENLLGSIEGLLVIGLFVGVPVGLFATRTKLGCVILLAVPIAMIAYVGWWQGQHPENVRSTSGLDFVFGPLWPSLGAIAGFYAGRALRAWCSRS
jgi:hypothetical protein